MQHSTSPDMSLQLGSAPVGRLLLKLAVPTVLAQLVNLLYNIVDRIYIGHMPVVGETALTGVGLCFPVIYLISAFAMLLGQGGAPRASIEMGKGNNREAERVLGTCFTSLILTAIPLTAVFLVFSEPMLYLFGASDNTIVYALPYMQIYASGSLFVMLALGLNLFITTQGYTNFAMAAVLIGAVTNIVLDPIFIYALHMGVSGAALATILSQALSAAFIVWFLVKSPHTTLRVRREHLRPKVSILLPVLALGLAPFVMQATEAVLNVAFNSSLRRYGGDVAVGAMTIASTVMQMVWLPAQGIGQGAQPIISYNYGARNPKRVKKAVWVMLGISAAYMVVLWGAVQLFPQVFVLLFNSESQALMDMGVWALRVYTAVMCLLAILMSAQQAFLSTGKAKASLVIACMRKVVLLIPLIYILPHFFENKVFAVFLAEPVADFISVAISALLFCTIFLRDIRAMEREQAQP